MAEDESSEQSDFEKVQGYLREQVQALFKAEVEKLQAQPQPGQPSPEQQQQQALKEYLNPVIQPDLAALRFENADTRDMMQAMSDATYQEYRDEVEDIFQKAKAAGRVPPARKDLARYLMGREAVETPAKFKERMATREKEQLERAASAADMGASTIARSPAQLAATAAEFAKLPSEEQAKYLEGVTL